MIINSFSGKNIEFDFVINNGDKCKIKKFTPEQIPYVDVYDEEIYK